MPHELIQDGKLRLINESLGRLDERLAALEGMSTQPVGVHRSNERCTKEIPNRCYRMCILRAGHTGGHIVEVDIAPEVPLRVGGGVISHEY